MASASKIVNMRLEYFRTRAKRNGTFTEADEREMKQGLVAQLGFITKIDFDTASAISIMLDGAEFLSEPTRAMIADIIHAKLAHSMPPESVCNSGPKIKFRAIEHYQFGRCWDLYGSNDADMNKLHRMSMQMAGLGMTTKWVDETTFGEAARSCPAHDP